MILSIFISTFLMCLGSCALTNGSNGIGFVAMSCIFALVANYRYDCLKERIEKLEKRRNGE